jgi:ATP-dependent Clp protease ATP-binding subunit ClpA
MLNKDLEKTLNEAFKLARDERHEFMTVEHLLLALLDNSSAHEALSSCGADVEQMRKEIRAFINQTTPLIPVTTKTKPSRRWASSACCNVPSSMSSRPAIPR